MTRFNYLVSRDNYPVSRDNIHEIEIISHLQVADIRFRYKWLSYCPLHKI